MPKKSREMSALEVGRLRESGLFAVGGVPGLYMQITGAAKSWILRAKVGTKRRDMGLGGFPAVTLAQAREKARIAREVIEAGTDPILERERAQSALRAVQTGAVTFAEAARRFIDGRSDEWRNDKHRHQRHQPVDRQPQVPATSGSRAVKAYQVDFEDYADIIDKSKVLHTWSTLGGMTVHVVEFSGNDVLIIGSVFDGGAIVIESDDAAFGGSTHDHVRNAIALGTL